MARQRRHCRATAPALVTLTALAVLAAACSSAAPEEPSGRSSRETSASQPADPTEAASRKTETTAAPTATAPPVPGHGPVAAPARHPYLDRSIYFVMVDRFENGDTSNDTAGIDGGPLDHGFLPTNRGYHHGGDLRGLIDRLPYIAGLGVNALWITPPFTNRYVQGSGTIAASSSSYHGYWQIDFDAIDPHLGTEADMIELVDAAHDLGMAVFFDAVLNHTGDVITFEENSFAYRSTSAYPYRDADGNEFDPAEVAGSADFPELDPAASFPYTPKFTDPAYATAKSPDWLNDVALYHNRGNTTFHGDSNIYGDFFGLDDLFTEHPVVVEGLIELWLDVIERYDIDGMRVDTMKHVDIEFWDAFAAAVLDRTAADGKPDFFFFGEVSGADPILASTYTNRGVPSVLDFLVDAALAHYVGGGNSGVVVQAFDRDDWYTDADTNASMLVTFFGNHDEGRMGYFISRANRSASEEVLLARMKLGFDLLFAIRGIPTVYYGDEQGFTGSGGDKLARQSMFPSVTPEYIDDDNIGSDVTPAADNFDPDHPLYQHVAALTALRGGHPALQRGAQITHDVGGPILAFSRLERDERVEYVVVANSNQSLTVPARFDVLSSDTVFRSIGLNEGPPVQTDGNGEFFVEVPPLTAYVYRASDMLPHPDETPDIRFLRPSSGGTIPSYRYRIEAEVDASTYAEVTFSAQIDGGEPILLGVDETAPYRIYWDTSQISDNTEAVFTATVVTGPTPPRSATTTATVGARP
ncbi:MAG: alpha-amylase family glycosyl hydrolase [Acidimicrobiaceae bacterium]|nr:alpha-amylase family glycosyl hydrolase [Acidimicrobiaceae bacterium]